MGEDFDVAIVGAGPAGISAACFLADRGVKTVVFERGAFPGSKNVSGGVIYGHDLSRVIPDFLEKNCPIERNIVESRIWYLSTGSGYSLSYRDRIFSGERRHNAFTVGRAKFDRWFATQASEKGALVLCSTVVTDLLRDGRNRVVGVDTDRPQGAVTARVVILADGINSPLAAKTGFRPEPKPHEVALAVKEVIELPEEMIEERFNVDAGEGVTIEILGEETQGMNGVAILYTNRRSLSLAVGVNLETLAKRRVRPYEILESFKAHPMIAPLIRGGKPIEYTAHWLAEGGYDSIPRLCGDGYLIAGDSGMLFNALHREGSNFAMASGRFAARAAADALKKGDTSREGLSGYVSMLEASYILKDLRKYRRFNPFLLRHPEIFGAVPQAAAEAAREMLTVDGVPKKAKQRAIWRMIKARISPIRLLRLAWDGWRSVR